MGKKHLKSCCAFIAGMVMPAAVCAGQGPLPAAPAPVLTQDTAPVRARSSTTLMPPGNSVFGSVPVGPATAETLDLTIEGAIDRALRYNLALSETGENVRMQRAARLRALSRLLPNVTARPSISNQQVNLAAFGFSGFPGMPSVVGPFNVYDARGSASVPVLNLRDLGNYRSAREEAAAAELSVKDTREQVVVIATTLYLQAVAGTARVEAQRSQVATAEAAYRQALDRKSAGTAPAIDVLRAQVQLQTEQQQLIFYEGEFEKQKLNLARAIGLPSGQVFRLSDTVPYSPLSTGTTLEATLERAYRQRADYQAAEALVRAAELARSAARAGFLPSAAVDANYGVIGNSPERTHGSFTVVAAVNIPIFQGGRVRADVEAAQAALRQRQAEVGDLRARIDAEVRTAFVDMTSASRQVEVAVQNLTLAHQQLEQAQDRFSAGVTNNLEVVQSQQAVAAANENHIAALYAFNAAKAALVRARGDAEQSIREYIRRKH